MKHNYTSLSLIKYLYGESSILRRLEIENAISENLLVRKEYSRLKKAFDKLPRLTFYPSDKTLKSIIDYSKRKDITTVGC